ncbi:MAG: hypothetical protein ABF296_05340, partial [Oceanococcaceae bacterium]
MPLRFLLPLLPAIALTACDGGRTTITPGDSPRAEPSSTVALHTPSTVDRYAPANGCFTLHDATSDEGMEVTADGAVRFSVRPAEATPLFWKPSTLGEYLLYDPQRRFISLPAAGDALIDGLECLTALAGWQVAGLGDTLLWLPPALDPVGNTVDELGDSLADIDLDTLGDLRGARALTATTAPDDFSRWILEDTADGFALTNAPTGIPLTSRPLELRPAQGCTAFPEAELNARGTPFKGTNPDGTVFGYAETHMHLGGSSALGGRLSYGQPFHPFGVEHALDDCAEHHGPNGAIDVLDTVVNAQRSFPPHATEGWPTYVDWPQWGSQTHHQTYYVWLQRAWMGGLRLMINHLVANEEICQLWPYSRHDCNEMESLELQLELIHELERYIDAQMGGPGKGFLRIVYSSAEARRTIENGQLAVVIGTENEKIFDCGEYLDQPLCTRDHFRSELARWYDKGVRAIFPIHLLDNAFGGTRISDDPALSALYQTANIVATGHPFATVPCDEADARAPHGETPIDDPRSIFDSILLAVLGPPPLNVPVPPLTGCVNNARGLTTMGADFIHALIDQGVMIETDHT